MITLNKLASELMNQYGEEFEGVIDFYINEVGAREHEYEDGIKGVVEDFSKGCVTGIVSGLIYYTDTCAFFEKYIDQINDLISNIEANTGATFEEWFGDSFDRSDIFCRHEPNQNLMAWFLFEQLNDSADIIIDNYEENED